MHGLLILDTESVDLPNVSRRRDAEQLYMRCAALMVRSVTAAGLRAVVVTNAAQRVATEFAELGLQDANIVERAFELPADRTIPHRAAHAKLALMRDLAASGEDALMAILDLDAVMLRAPHLGEALTPGRLACFDITPAMFAESGGRCENDVRRISNDQVRVPRWFGGEMVVGDAAAFRSLVEMIDLVEPRYWAEHAGLYHSGDEAPVSTALNLLRERGHHHLDLGEGRHLARWWSTWRPFAQQSLSEAGRACVLHLPADKAFLAGEAGHAFVPSRFLRRYRRHVARRLAVRRLASRFGYRSGEQLACLGPPLALSETCK
ncbi:hypothetical protein DVW87_00800 [Sphingomonas aracearum]|uniref:Nucleotide-diphospho-sugar transferase domain-containing protein n=1 Tax=Sphingomonas aracearum TaxID=2283317 RepID=A0A369VW21_9SPHN|nr:hypothetical protein DVW87_00800 [Sphingomonas aracearum]